MTCRTNSSESLSGGCAAAVTDSSSSSGDLMGRRGANPRQSSRGNRVTHDDLISLSTEQRSLFPSCCSFTHSDLKIIRSSSMTQVAEFSLQQSLKENLLPPIMKGKGTNKDYFSHNAKSDTAALCFPLFCIPSIIYTTALIGRSAICKTSSTTRCSSQSVGRKEDRALQH